MYIHNKETFDSLLPFQKELVIDHVLRDLPDDDDCCIIYLKDGVIEFRKLESDEEFADYIEYAVFKEIFIKELIFGEVK